MSGELSPMAKGLLIAAAFVVVVAGLKAAETVLVPFLLSVFIALIFSPLLAWLKERRVPNVVAICLIIALVVLIGWLIGILVGSSISDFRKNLPAYQEGLQQLSGGLLTWLGEHGVKLDMEQMRNSFDPGKIMQLAGNTLSSLGNAMTNAFLILLTVIFILAEQVGFSEKLQLARKDNGVSRDTMQKLSGYQIAVELAYRGTGDGLVVDSRPGLPGDVGVVSVFAQFCAEYRFNYRGGATGAAGTGTTEPTLCGAHSSRFRGG